MLIQQYQRTCTTWPFSQGRATCQQYLNEARSEVATIVNDSFGQCDQDFRQRIAELEASDKPKDRKHANVLRQMIQKERKRQMFRELKALRNTGGAAGVTRIEIPAHPDVDPKECTEWRSIDIPSEVLEHLQTRNRQHFGQARDTPFASPPLSEDFGYCANTIEAQALLDGHYSTDQVDNPTVQLFLDHMHQIQTLADQKLSPTIAVDEFTSKLKVWRESTSTSPS
jgi:hypothetical protein